MNNIYNYIVSFLSKKYTYPFNEEFNPFNEEFRKGYKNAWIDKIKDYTP